MRGLRILLAVAIIGFAVSSCKTHERCPAYGGYNIDEDNQELPVHSTDVNIEEEKA